MIYPLNITDKLEIGFSLYEQYKFLLSSTESTKPELYLKLICSEDDLSEFHHILWKLPYYNKVYHITTKQEILNTTEIYCQIVDAENIYSELCKIIVWRMTKYRFSNSWTTKKESISSKSMDFNPLFLKIMDCSNNISYDDLPEGIQKNFISLWY